MGPGTSAGSCDGWNICDMSGLGLPIVLQWEKAVVNLGSAVDPFSTLWDPRFLIKSGENQDPPSTLNWRYMVPNSRYLGPNKG